MNTRWSVAARSWTGGRSGAAAERPRRRCMLMLETEVRNALWRRLIEIVERYTTEVPNAPVAPPLDVEAVRRLLALRSQPVLYISAEGHHSFAKAARLCGLGSEAVREVRVDARLRMRPADLAARIREDREAGLSPFFVVATAGSTGAGVVDP